MRNIFNILAFIVSINIFFVEGKWWQTMSLYQIYPRSFKDSDGNGIGDLKGIQEKLEYLKDAGVDAFWLSPVFQSPMVDMGYDISNFVDIEPIFGNLNDFDDLLEKAHGMGLKVLMDFVPNHSSDQHEWFQKSVKNIEPYSDFYVWKNGTVRDDGTRIPPSNWLNIFGGTAWEWNDERNAYYLHQFTPQQPDLNFRNPIVVEEIKDVLRFWMDRGVDGFRIDALPHLFEDELFRDEPPSGLNVDPSNFWYLSHKYTMHRQENFEMLRSWREVVDEYDDRVLLVEFYGTVKSSMKYYDYGANFPFNFCFSINLDNISEAWEYKKSIDEWMSEMPEGGTANWVVGNHDQNRTVNRFGPKRANLVIAMSLLLPGVSVTYNGEEIGMSNNYVSWEETTDPQGCNAGIEAFEYMSRDPARTPFLWDNTTSAGFSENPHTWLPVNPDYEKLNLDVQKKDNDSVFKYFQSLGALRTWPARSKGELTTHTLNKNILAFSRTLEGERSIYVVINFSGERQNIDLTIFDNIPNEVVIYRTSPGSNLRHGENINPKNAEIPPLAAVIYVTA